MSDARGSLSLKVCNFQLAEVCNFRLELTIIRRMAPHSDPESQPLQAEVWPFCKASHQEPEGGCHAEMGLE